MRLEALRDAVALSDAGDTDLAWRRLRKEFVDAPNDPQVLWTAAHVMERADNVPTAYQLAKRAAELAPKRFDVWLKLGHCEDLLWLTDDSERSYRNALKYAVNDEQKAAALNGLAALFLQQGEFIKAEAVATNALRHNPVSLKAKGNLGFAQLASRKWEIGWENYHASLGWPTRRRKQYADEPEWDGTKGLNVVIYGEQGIGDEISFASMIPDAVKECNKVIIECDPRLKNLFQRSFPETKVYGTRNVEHLEWAEEDRDFHASTAMGALGGIYRTTPDSFPGTPYLVPDFDRVTMWQALWKTKKKPVIGIAWTGGMKHTGSDFRKWTTDDLLPILKTIDAHWVCLEYKDAEETCAALREKGIDIAQYPWGTLTNDYDDTAGLVASLDRVVSMQTAIVHLCGALGITCDVFVPKTSQWRYGEAFTSLPWYKSVRVIRQAVRGHWKNTIEEYARKTSAELGESSRLRVA